MRTQKKANQKQSSFVKNLFVFTKKYYLLFIIVCCVGFVSIVSIYKMFISKPIYVYARIKVGQGYWWASTQQPSLWFVNAIEAAKEQKDLTGKPIAKIYHVDSYPYYGTNQFNVFVIVKLKVSKTGKGSYSFNRSEIGVSSPIDLEFPNVQFSGTIIELSDKPILSKLVAKTVYLTKKYSYPWEFDEIKIGDTFSNGNENVIEVLDKAKGETNEVLVSDQGKLISASTEAYNYIILKLKMMVHKEGSQLLYAEEVSLSPGRGFDFVTNGYVYNNYMISKIE